MNSKVKGIITVIIAVLVVAAAALFFSHQLKATDDAGEFADPAAQVSEELALSEGGETAEEAPEAGEETGVVEEQEIIIASEETETPEVADITDEAAEEALAEEPVAPEVAPTEKSVVVTSSLAGLDKVSSGTPVKLHADLYGFDGANYTLQWQKSLDGVVWENVEGANQADYTFLINRENCKYIWRVAVDVK